MTTTNDEPSAAQPAAVEPDFARHVLELLFPAPHLVVTTWGRRDALRFHALPSTASPRHLVPAAPRAAAARTAVRQLRGPRLRTRAARLAIGSLVRVVPAGSPWPKGYTVREHPTAPSVLSWLRDALGRSDIVTAVALGRPRANRKPVIQVVDPAGSALGFAKVGHNALTRSLVAHETAALAALASSNRGRLRVPKVVDSSELLDLQLLLISPLPTDRPGVRPPSPQQLLDAVRDIAGVGGVRRRRWTHTPQAERVADRMAGLGNRGEFLLPAVSHLRTRDPDVLLGAWLGDLNPGNLAADGATVMVWDWERYETDVPLGSDLLHHELMRDVTVRSVPPAQAAQALVHSAPALLAPLGLAEAEAATVVLDYLLRLAVRFLGDGQDEMGASLGQVETWLAPALETVTAREQGA
jgi:hypothetical protein